MLIHEQCDDSNEPYLLGGTQLRPPSTLVFTTASSSPPTSTYDKGKGLGNVKQDALASRGCKQGKPGTSPAVIAVWKKLELDRSKLNDPWFRVTEKCIEEDLDMFRDQIDYSDIGLIVGVALERPQDVKSPKRVRYAEQARKALEDKLKENFRAGMNGHSSPKFILHVRINVCSDGNPIVRFGYGLYGLAHVKLGLVFCAESCTTAKVGFGKRLFCHRGFFDSRPAPEVVLECADSLHKKILQDVSVRVHRK